MTNQPSFVPFELEYYQSQWEHTVDYNLADSSVNILDISQTIVSGYFNMMMIVDMNSSTKKFGIVSEELEKLGEDIGVIIKCQKEEIFDSMHRI